MKKWFFTIGTVLFALCVYFQIKDMQEYKEKYASQVNSSTITSFQSTSCDFYYDGLTPEEKKLFDEIVTLYTKGGVEIVLEEPCSMYNMFRVADAVRETQKNNYWNFVFPYCFDEERNPIELNGTDTEERIYRILIQFSGNHLSDEKAIEEIDQYEELKTFLENNLQEDNFETVNKEIQKEKEQIVQLLKKKTGISEEETVEFFREWVLQNIEYNYEAAEEINKINRLILPESYVKNTSSACVLERSGICSGMSDLIVDLCNMVGIEAYSVKGNLSVAASGSGAHQWVAVVIDKKVYYFDPTKDAILQKKAPLYNEEQFYGRETEKYTPLSYYDY